MAKLELTKRGVDIVLTIEAETNDEDREIERFARFSKNPYVQLQNNPCYQYHTLEILREL